LDILIIGAGAIGALVGAKLAQAGHTVTLVGRPRFVAAVAQRGLLLQDEHGRHQILGTTPAVSVAEAFSSQETYDFTVLTVKSYDTATAVKELTQASPASTWPTVVSLQNGVGNEESIAQELGPASVIAGTITTPVSTVGSASMQVEKADYCVGLSPWHPAVSSVAYAAVQSALTEAGFSVTPYADARSMKWTKLLMNMVGNATCAILDMPPDQVFADRLTANLEIEAWRETFAVIRKAGIAPANIGSYPFTLLAPMIRTMPLPILRRALRNSVGKARGGKMPSLHIDLENGRSHSEVCWLNGATVRKGEEVGVATPVNRMLTEVLLRLVQNPSERDVWRHNPERLGASAAQYRNNEDRRTTQTRGQPTRS
jgi:2-dehydropantoate 2-reductase